MRYDYRCEECGEFELTQRITEDAITTCPHCESSCRRLISKGQAVIFRGSGFYCTDYRKKDKPAKESESITDPIKPAKPSKGKDKNSS